MPLHRQFRYIHEPLPAGDGAIPVLGHEALVDTLKERLTYSHGGAFLVSGFRGVGKSTLVLRALAETSALWGDRDVMLVVHLNVARSMTTDQLLFAVVRRIFESLDDRDLLARLPREVQRALLLAYSRTSLSFTQTQSESTERGTTLGLAPQHRLAPTMSFSGRRTRSQATEAAFLAYSETDVEHDLVRIVQLLNGSEGRPDPVRRSRRLLRRRHRRDATRIRVHPVIVLDEVDKLTDNDAEAIALFEALLGRIKNVLTARGAHFIVVAGPDLYDRALQDSDRGNGVYESVFGWRMYVPCLWDAPGRLVHGLVRSGRPQPDTPSAWGPPAAPYGPLGPYGANAPGPGTYVTYSPESTYTIPRSTPDDLRLARFIAYLRFKARGVPRRLLQEFNSLVVWEDGLPSLSVNEEVWARVDFYARLEDVVSETMTASTPDGSAGVLIDDDRRLLGGYHVVEWTLRSEGRPFTSTDVTGPQGLDSLLRMTPPAVERLLRHLVRAGVLDLVSEPGRPDVTRYGGAESALAYYKLSDAYKRQLAGFVRSSESERADLGIATPPPGPDLYGSTMIGARSTPAEPPPAADGAPGAGAPVITPAVAVLAERYEMSSLLGQGGMGAVYRGRDLLTGRQIAVKVLHHRLREDEQMLSRFRREAEVSRQLNHPQIVRTLDALDGPDTEPALIMELVEGPSLQEVLDERGALPVGLVARIGRQLGEALAFIDTMGVSRIDLKPSNVLLHPERGAVVIDLGIARPSVADYDVTIVGMVIGTPGYMAPEQALGNPSDIRTDLYTLGILMYQCLTGTLPWSASSDHQVIYEIVHRDVPVDALAVSEELRALLGRMLSRDADTRPQSPEEYLRELAATPEAGEEAGPETLEAEDTATYVGPATPSA
ncbi:protein kinase [Streptomyces sp. SID13726]|uniref:protein kinase domain-containing protein n=1 Tax=Streptomyces sp. SID13726 TaxID=2706058 RepID=UPI0013BB0DEE|nr:protein kinase [Streptomyces sp. SID13726]NEB02784.1 protein kinase [Streptomyces sp. SID13726]